MDVVAPAPPSEDKPHDPPQPDSATPMAVVTDTAKVDDPKAKPAKPAKPASPKSGGNSTTLAVVATVIIVFGLAVLAVMAYLKSK